MPQPPSPCRNLIVNVTLHGKRVVVDVIKLRVLTRGDYLGLSEWIPNAITCILLRGKQREILTVSHRGGGDVKMAQREDVGLEDWSDAATSQGTPEATKTWKREEQILLE